MAGRMCSKCRITKPTSEFSANRSRPDGLDVHCRTCIRERIRLKRQRHLAAGACADCGQPRGGAGSRRHCVRCADRWSGRSTITSRELRQKTLVAYSGAVTSCACCGERGARFLTLDHIEGGGRAHRQLKGSQGVYRELARAGFPPGYQVLCFNCNFVIGLYGACPHQAANDRVRHRGHQHPASIDAGAAVEVKRCTACRQQLPLDAFYADRGTTSGRQSRCRTCTCEAAAARLRAARQAALAHYSAGDSVCACCGEREQMFLALDHIDGSGPRKPGGRRGGNSFFTWLAAQGYPAGLRVLCHNCNCAKGRNPECPHVMAQAVA
jgi:hypothetical protein